MLYLPTFNYHTNQPCTCMYIWSYIPYMDRLGYDIDWRWFIHTRKPTQIMHDVSHLTKLQHTQFQAGHFHLVVLTGKTMILVGIYFINNSRGPLFQWSLTYTFWNDLISPHQGETEGKKSNEKTSNSIGCRRMIPLQPRIRNNQPLIFFWLLCFFFNLTLYS